MTPLSTAAWPEAKLLAEPQALGLWPVGSVEAHGPHLPLETDLVISRGVAVRAGRALEERGYRPVLLPPLPFGVTRYAGEFPGTLGISEETLCAIVREVGAELGRHGLRRLCLVNQHLEPAQLVALDRATRELSAHGPLRAIAPNPCERRWARTLGDEFKRGECHAGAYETSLVLACEPALVHEPIARALPHVPIDLAKAMRAGVQTFREAGAGEAYFGEPARATREEGERLLIQLVLQTVTEVLERLPL
ncbi:MAG: creatininase family protein [Deltaproteobacteria bacterium]